MGHAELASPPQITPEHSYAMTPPPSTRRRGPACKDVFHQKEQRTRDVSWLTNTPYRQLCLRAFRHRFARLGRQAIPIRVSIIAGETVLNRSELERPPASQRVDRSLEHRCSGRAYRT